MPIALHTPRINNNDDTVRLSKILVEIGAAIRKGDPIIDIETDKAAFTIESEHDGYLLHVIPELGATIDVGSILAWIGASKDEAVPASAETRGADASREPSLKAAILISKYGLEKAAIPASGSRLSVADVERYIESRGLRPSAAQATAASSRSTPAAPGRLVEPAPAERGMLRTVEWHRTQAAAGYLELAYDPSEWERYAGEFQQSKRLLLNPLLSLMAWRLVQIAKARPEINATVEGESRYVYTHVNLGFTVQVGERLYIVVVPEADLLGEDEFVDRLGQIQRSAMKNALAPANTSGATIGFSSMARWPVTRHMPVLAPHTAMMVAHTAARNGEATLGATYDHRVLSGWHVVRVLQDLANPNAAL